MNPIRFNPKEEVISLVYHHPPEIEPGTKVVIVQPHRGYLFAVELPNGTLHRWFADEEMQPIPPFDPNRPLPPGSFANVKVTRGHPSNIVPNMLVRIVKALGPIMYYDVMIGGVKYHRWLADYELFPARVLLPPNL